MLMSELVVDYALTDQTELGSESDLLFKLHAISR